VILLTALVGLIYVALDASQVQRARTASENQAHARELLLHLVEVADSRERLLRAAQAIEEVRVEMFRALDYHSRVRVRLWQHGQLLYNSIPALAGELPEPGAPRARGAYAWVRAVERDAATGLLVERSHEVDDQWMLGFNGITFLLNSTVLSLP